VADSPAPGESLIKKEADLPPNDPIVSRSTSGWMLVCALLMTISIAWALYDEAFGQRPWKGMQKEFVSRYTRYLDRIKANAGKSETDIKESPEYQKLDEEEKAARAEVDPEIKQIDAEVAIIQRKLDAVTDPFQNQRGRLTVINYNIETANGSAKERYRRQAEAKKQEEVSVDMPSDDGTSTKAQNFKYAELEALYNELRDKKAERLGRKAELLKTPSELTKKRDDYLKNQLIGLGPVAIEGLKTKMASYDYSILGHQISVNAYNIVDRCARLSAIPIAKYFRFTIPRSLVVPVVTGATGVRQPAMKRVMAAIVSGSGRCLRKRTRKRAASSVMRKIASHRARRH
jgi:hypothetical protein